MLKLTMYDILTNNEIRDQINDLSDDDSDKALLIFTNWWIV